MIYRLLLICLLIALLHVITAESYYERGRSDGTELAHHIYSLIVKSDMSCEEVQVNRLLRYEIFLRGAIGYSLHSEAFAEFKAYYEGFYEAFIHHVNVELYQSSSLKPPLKEWIHHLYKMTCEICQVLYLPTHSSG